MSLSKDVSAITECSVCNQPFVDPRILPCVHTFCLQCLESYSKGEKQDGKVICPLCKATSLLPSKRFSDLPVNFFIQKLLEVRNVTDESQKNFCGVCYTGQKATTNAVVHCFDCRQNLCGKCLNVHNNLAYIRGHQVVEFGQKTADELLQVTPSFCNSHRDELVKFYCSECQTAICMTCYVEAHSSHKCANIGKVSEEFLQDLKAGASKVAGNIGNCLCEVEKLQIKKENFLQDMRGKESLVLEIFSEFHQLLDSYEKQILVDVKSVTNAKLREFETTKNSIHDTLLRMDSYKAYTDEFSAKATPADIARFAPTLKQRAAELNAIRLDNDLRAYDIDINLSNLTRLLSQKLKNTDHDIAVYHSRKGIARPYSSPAIVIVTPTIDLPTIMGMASVKQEIYVLTKCSAAEEKAHVSKKKVLIGASTLRLMLPATFTYADTRSAYYGGKGNLEIRNCANYTASDAILCHLELWYCNASATEPETLELRVSSISLIESEGNVISTAVFDLGHYRFGQPLQEKLSVTLPSPTKLFNGGAQCTVFEYDISSTMSDVVVQASISELNSVYHLHTSDTFRSLNRYTDVHYVADPSILSLRTFSELPSSFSLQVLGKSAEASCLGITKTMGDAIIGVALPSRSAPGSDIVYSHPYDTKYEYVLLHLKLIYTESSSTAADTLTLHLSDLIASESHQSFMESNLFDISPYRLGKETILNQNFTFKTGPNLTTSDFHGVQVEVQVNAALCGITVAISKANFISNQGDYITEASLDIPTYARMESLMLRRTIRLPSSIDPGCMTSCDYYEVIYIGDCKTSDILRVEPTGKLVKWSVDDSPSGLSVSPSHNLVATFSAASKIREYTTLGVLVRDIQITGVSNPKLSLQITDEKFLLLAEASPVDGTATPIFLVTTLNEPNLKDEGDDRPTDAIIHHAKCATASELGASSRAPLREGDSGSGINISSGVVQEIKGILLNKPIHAIMDRFGFIWILTAIDSKVHLLGPELNYLGEILSLGEYMYVTAFTSPPRYICFEQDSGRLYFASESMQHLQAFQVTEGRIDKSVWRNDT